MRIRTALVGLTLLASSACSFSVTSCDSETERLVKDGNNSRCEPRPTPSTAVALEPLIEKRLYAPRAGRSRPSMSPKPVYPSIPKVTIASPRPQRRAQVGTTIWDSLMRCEAWAHGKWQANTGNGYYGGLQFSLSSWRAVGGTGYPHLASREEQIKRGKMLQARQGWGAWPHCSHKLGLR